MATLFGVLLIIWHNRDKYFFFPALVMSFLSYAPFLTMNNLVNRISEELLRLGS